LKLNGNELSYNNNKNGDSSLQIILQYEETTLVTFKRINPCQICTLKLIKAAWDPAYETDFDYIFGGIMVLN
jgi:phosphoribosylaminoimidazolecarboxamide formyltransferase/IMP cyclohydrolase